jgi:hypothetical protein
VMVVEEPAVNFAGAKLRLNRFNVRHDCKALLFASAAIRFGR